MTSKTQILFLARAFEFYVARLWPLHRRFVRRQYARRCKQCAASEKMYPLSELKKCSKISFAHGDITDLESLRRGIPEEVDAVFHIAGSVENLPHHLEYTRYRINQTGTQNVVTACLEKKVKRLIYTTTVLTLDFHADRPLTENSQPNRWTRDAYIQSKHFADIEVEKGLERGLDAVFMHPSAIFGSFDKATWSKMFLEINRGLPFPIAPPGGGSVCYVREVARAHVTAFHRAPRGSHYILGGPDETWLNVAQSIAKILGKPGPKWACPIWLFKVYGFFEHLLSTKILKRDPMLTPHTTELLSETIYSKSDKAIRDLNYRMVPLEEMLEDCFQWMIETKRLPKSAK